MAPQKRGKAMKSNDTTFVQITNQQIYNELQDLKISLGDLNRNISTMNTKVCASEKKYSLVQKLVFGAYTFTMAVLAWFIAHISGK